VKLIVGLGNPGPEYEQTPHNMGFLALDLIAQDCGVTIANRRHKALTATAKLAGHDVLLAKPETFMNLSGHSVRDLVREQCECLSAGGEFDVTKDLIVVYDELAFPLGVLRIKPDGSSAGHNGVQSIIDAVGDKFIRVRIGIAPDHPVSNGRSYVLSPWKKKDLETVGAMLERAGEAVKTILSEGVGAAMNKFNRRDETAEGKGM
jgi:PTH1 family peptidyl-tRNA hydrolase